MGFAGDAEPLCVVPNLAAKAKGDKRLHLADEVEALRDLAQLSLRRPVDRGFVVNSALQRDILERVFKRILKASSRTKADAAAARLLSAPRSAVGSLARTSSHRPLHA